MSVEQLQSREHSFSSVGSKAAALCLKFGDKVAEVFRLGNAKRASLVTSGVGAGGLILGRFLNTPLIGAIGGTVLGIGFIDLLCTGALKNWAGKYYQGKS